MLEVALTPKIAPSVAELLQEDTWHSGSLTDSRISGERWGGAALSEDSTTTTGFGRAGLDRAGSRVKCAVFYSISSTQSGLVRCHCVLDSYEICNPKEWSWYGRAGLT
jgi:hypothetical protein